MQNAATPSAAINPGRLPAAAAFFAARSSRGRSGGVLGWKRGGYIAAACRCSSRAVGVGAALE